MNRPSTAILGKAIEASLEGGLAQAMAGGDAGSNAPKAFAKLVMAVSPAILSSVAGKVVQFPLEAVAKSFSVMLKSFL